MAVLAAIVPSAVADSKPKMAEAEQVRQMIDKANRYWQENNSPETSPFWHYAAYHTGNMEAYFLTGNEDYLKYSEAWAEHNEWKGAKSDDKSQWKYSYGESDEYVLFGDYNPAGRMPLTTYRSDADLPEFTDYSMKNRTYRYFKGEPRYPFGYGLSYTSFAYSGLTLPAQAETGRAVEVSAVVKNTGRRDGDEVVQLYLTHSCGDSIQAPICALKGFRRVHLKAGEERKVSFRLLPEDLALTDSLGNTVERAGQLEVFVGGGQPRYAEGQRRQLQLQGDPYQIN